MQLTLRPGSEAANRLQATDSGQVLDEVNAMIDVFVQQTAGRRVAEVGRCGGRTDHRHKSHDAWVVQLSQAIDLSGSRYGSVRRQDFGVDGDSRRPVAAAAMSRQRRPGDRVGQQVIRRDKKVGFGYLADVQVTVGAGAEQSDQLNSGWWHLVM